MDINQKLEVIRKALEKGAHIKLSFYDVASQEEAKETVDSLGSKMEIPTEQLSREGVHWCQAYNWEKKVEITAFYNDDSYMEEDVFFEELS